jgi:nucleotide-binding universal stress UspA family protein
MSILCATDFSPSYQSATQLAVALAKSVGDSLSLLHIIEPFVPALPYAVTGAAEWRPPTRSCRPPCGSMSTSWRWLRMGVRAWHAWPSDRRPRRSPAAAIDPC